MVKIDLVKKVSEYGLNKIDAAKIIDLFLELIKKALIKGEKVQLVNFGYFEVREKKSRIGINPQTKEKISISVRRSPIFKPAGKLKKAVNKK